MNRNQQEVDRRIRQFARERDAALRSLDMKTLILTSKRWGQTIHRIKTTDDAGKRMFWVVIHKARAAAISLTQEERFLSRAWLYANDAQPLDGVAEADEYRSWRMEQPEDLFDKLKGGNWRDEFVRRAAK